MKTVKNDVLSLLVKENVPKETGSVFGEKTAAETLRFHQSLPVYAPTKLIPLPALAKELGLGGIRVKDESTRFGLKAFKGLGGSWAIFRLLCERLGLDHRTAVFSDLTSPKMRKRCAAVEFATATDGNHGKGVAWAAKLFGSQAHVYMPKGSVEARRAAIEEVGAAEAVITEFNYDGAVAYAAEQARRNGWILVQDTAWEGYEEIPTRIVEGYMTLAAEAAQEFDREGIVPTHVFLQAGVGSMAGGVLAYLRQHYGAGVKGFVAEPTEADCIYLSAEAGDGKAHVVEGLPETVMAGLNCGTPCSIIWPLLRDQAFGYVRAADSVTEEGMRRYAHPLPGDPAVVSGESGAVTLGIVMEAAKNKALREAVGFTEDSQILLINTEGATDPDHYRAVTGI